MKEFISEYGGVILVIILTFMMIAFTTPLGNAITTSILDIVNDFIGTAEKFFQEITVTDFGAAAPTP